MSDPITNRATLEKVDKLRELNIRDQVSLPQLVVVGDQSSGKSSLLESLTGIPFPTNTELCTRYVTQITCRRDIYSRVEVSLIPGPSATPERRAKLEAFSHQPLDPEEFRTKFADILYEVNECLGIRLDINDASSSGTVFTDDILKIEVSSPDEDYLTIIDVPGIFRTAQGVTTNRDIVLVRNMVESYIKDPRTIILAVLPANVDTATQEILTLSEKYDPHGERTLGVLTKPDLILEGAGKKTACSIVLGQRKPLKLGYFLVCNRGPDGDVRSLRQRELMFQEDPWKSLPKERLGVAALKRTLGELLGSLTKSVFGALRLEIQEKIENAEVRLRELGSPRETEQQQRMFLSSIAGKFAALVASALHGNYWHDDAFEQDPDLRLCTNIVNLADDLVRDFENLGHSYRFEKETPAPVAKRIKPESPHGSMTFHSDTEPEDVSPAISTPISVALSSDSADFDKDISGLLHPLPAYGPPRPGIQAWIVDLHRQYRGQELISPGPAILGSAFKEQSARWGAIARSFVSTCVRAVHTFIRRALSLLCPSETLASELWNSISDEVISRYKKSLERAVYLARVERSLTPYTLNHLFAAEVMKTRSVRLVEKLKGMRKDNMFGDNSGVMSIDTNAIQNFADQEANTSHLNHEIHDALKAYYKVAAQRFRDNLYMQAVSDCLMTGEESPLGVFSQEWVIGLSAGELEELAGDSLDRKLHRKEVEEKKGNLEKAIKILRG